MIRTGGQLGDRGRIESHVTSPLHQSHLDSEGGFSFVELIVSMVISVVILTVAITVYSAAMQTRDGEHLVSEGNAKVNSVFALISREIGNSGFGLVTNGIVIADSGASRIRVRANISMDDSSTDDADEDLTFYFDADENTVVRFDPSTGGEILASGVESMSFEYRELGGVSVGAVPTASTVSVVVRMQVPRKKESVESEGDFITHEITIPLRNSPSRLASY